MSVEPTPAQQQLIENNLLLKQAIKKLDGIERTQQTNHLVAIQLRDHNTIARVDSMWTTMGHLSFLTKVTAGLLSTLVALAITLTFTHLIWRWP